MAYRLEEELHYKLKILVVFLPGVVPPNIFDRLQTASFLGGYNANISGNMPAMSHYVTTGMDPFVAVYTAVEVHICRTFFVTLIINLSCCYVFFCHLCEVDKFHLLLWVLTRVMTNG